MPAGVVVQPVGTGQAGGDAEELPTLAFGQVVGRGVGHLPWPVQGAGFKEDGSQGRGSGEVDVPGQIHQDGQEAQVADGDRA